MKRLNFKLGFSLHLLLFVLLIGCTKDQVDSESILDLTLHQQISSYSTTGDASYYILPDGSNYNLIPQDPQNLLTSKKITLGKFLFFETAFGLNSNHESGKGTYSCASCHIPEKGFRPDNIQGIADGGVGYAHDRRIHSDYRESELDVQEARPLNLINVAYVTNTSWNGSFGSRGANEGTEGVWSQLAETNRNHLGYEGLETQNIQGMITHRMLINKDLTDKHGYTDLFDSSFPGVRTHERYTTVMASLAISAYLRSVISDKAPFQKWLKGESSAMTEEEKQGGILFFGKANCVKCHYKENLGSDEFHALGVNDMDQHPKAVKANNPIARRNLGRGGFTLNDEDNYKFKVPGIYNVGDAEHFFHGSSIQTLEELIEYKNLAKKENDRVDEERISPKFVSLNLDSKEKKQLLAFVKNALRDPEIMRYQPDQVLSGNCFPNNDIESLEYLDCN